MNQAHHYSEQSVVNYGVSEQLRSEFALLREIAGLGQQPKFTHKTVDMLAQHLVCRHYSNLCYEFAHLNWALVFVNAQDNSIGSKTASIERSLLDYYWISQCCRPSRFKTYFSDRLSQANCVDDADIFVAPNFHALATKVETSELTGISITIHDQVFIISASRASVLACFMEWLVGVVPNLLGLIEDSLLGKGHNAIKEFSSALQKHIYDYLGDHLPPAKLQIKYRLMQAWYTQSNNRGDKEQRHKSRSIVNDENMLQFWQEHNKQEGYGKFSSVVKDSLAYQQAIDIVNTSSKIQSAHANDEINEVLSNSTSEQQDSMYAVSNQYLGQNVIDVKALVESPKAINKQALELIELAAYYPQYIVELSQSWLRLQVFGKAQHSIIQRMRVKREPINGVEDVVSLLNPDYDWVRQASIALVAQNQQTLLAIAHILRSEAPKQSCLLLLKLMPLLNQYKAYVDTFKRILDEDSAHTPNLTESNLAQWQLAYPWFKDLINQSQLAYSHINRQGFTAKTRLSSHHYAYCASTLLNVNKLIKQLLMNISKKEQHTAALFNADRLIFQHEFISLYVRENS